MNKQEKKEYMIIWHQNHPNYHKNCYKNNPEKEKENSKKWLKNHPNYKNNRYPI